jgi:glucan phosphoethanolaminetransferase (alkaline phosphatase superfamily)
MPASETHHSRASRRPLRILIFTIAIDIGVCVAVVEAFRQTHDISVRLLAVHLPLVLALFAASVLVATPLLWIRRVREHRATPYLIVIGPALTAAALLFLYAANFASNSVLGENVTRQLIRLWMSDWWRGGTILGLSRWLALIPLSIAVASLAAHLWVVHRMHADIVTLLRDVRAWPARPGRLIIGAAVAVVMAYAAFFYELSWRTSRSDLLTSDPVLAFGRRSLDVFDDSRQALVERVRNDDVACRASYPRNVTFDRRNVIIIMVDSLRADHTGVYGYHRQTTPFLSDMLKSGKLKKVDFATSTCAESNCGIISTLASKTLPNVVPQNFKLYDLLHDLGYATHLILSGNHDWRGLRELYGREHTSYFEGRDSRRYGPADDRALLEGLDRVPDFTTPAFFYFHLMSPHVLGHKQEGFRTFQPFEVTNNLDALLRGQYKREPIANTYDNGVLQADAIIKDLFAALDRKGYLRNSIVVILADHGEGLGDRGPRQFGHVTSLYQELIGIPMLIYDDSAAEYRHLDFATQIDVAPTIADRMGLPIPGCWQGHSLLSTTSTDVSRHQTSLTRPCYALIERSKKQLYKYMSCGDGRREELYDLATDPGERQNLTGTVDPAVLARLRSRLHSKPGN